MTDRRHITRGTIYLHGAPSRFEPTIRAALGLKGDEAKLTFDLCIDGLRSVWHRHPVYRVDYTLDRAGTEPPPERAAPRSEAGFWQRLGIWFAGRLAAASPPITIGRL